MATNLVIVESPAKAKTIKKYLGKDFEVLASYGHVRDLVEKEGAVDPEHGFAMKYALIDKNKPRVDAIERAARKAAHLYLATDPDREGEAISWHLAEILKDRGVLDGRGLHRVRFYEVTKNAIREALEQPEDLNESLVNAQQARRALDYLARRRSASSSGRSTGRSRPRARKTPGGSRPASSSTAARRSRPTRRRAASPSPARPRHGKSSARSTRRRAAC